MTNPLAITVTDLTKRFDGKTILAGVHLAVQPGQTVCLIGPSGGGKSTLLRCVNGLNTFDGGTIQVGPHRLQPGDGAVANTIRRTVGMVFQDFRLFPHRTALENVIEAPRHVLGTPAAQART